MQHATGQTVKMDTAVIPKKTRNSPPPSIADEVKPTEISGPLSFLIRPKQQGESLIDYKTRFFKVADNAVLIGHIEEQDPISALNGTFSKFLHSNSKDTGAKEAIPCVIDFDKTNGEHVICMLGACDKMCQTTNNYQSTQVSMNLRGVSDSVLEDLEAQDMHPYYRKELMLKPEENNPNNKTHYLTVAKLVPIIENGQISKYALYHEHYEGDYKIEHFPELIRQSKDWGELTDINISTLRYILSLNESKNEATATRKESQRSHTALQASDNKDLQMNPNFQIHLFDPSPKAKKNGYPFDECYTSFRYCLSCSLLRGNRWMQA